MESRSCKQNVEVNAEQVSGDIKHNTSFSLGSVFGHAATVYDIYRVPLPTQLYFFLSIFKTDNNLKTIMANYHLHSMSIFLHYQIRFSCAHALILAFVYTSVFSVLHVHMPIFQLNSWKISQ